MWRAARILVIALVAAGAMAAPARAQAPASCTPTGKNQFVRDVLTDIYFWYQHLPRANPATFTSPEAYLEAVRYRPLDNTFSYITSRAANGAFYSDSQYIGFGFSTSVAGGAMRVLQVFPASPAAEIGLTRGAWIREINGVSVADLIARNEIDGAFGPAEIGVEARIAFETTAGEVGRARMVKRLVTIPTVSLSRVFDVSGRKVGYIFFRNFVEPSFAALDAAFAEMRAAGVHDLILDVRYNGGGLVDVAQHLASAVGGIRTQGQVFAEFFHNDKHGFRNRVTRFEPREDALGLDRLIVITTQASASASELVINALRPFIPVVVIGERTYGKPVGQYGIEFCDKVLAPVAFTLRNANGEGDFFGGFAPDCAAADDASHELGDVQEASLREALTFAWTNACGLAPSSTEVRPLDRTDARRASGWQSVVNAH